jgi:hypothetical protein
MPTPFGIAALAGQAGSNAGDYGKDLKSRFPPAFLDRLSSWLIKQGNQPFDDVKEPLRGYTESDKQRYDCC